MITGMLKSATLAALVAGVSLPCIVPVSARAAIPNDPATIQIPPPAKPGGYVNYGAVYNRIISRDVTPANNAAIPILAACRHSLYIGVWKKVNGRYAFQADRRQMHHLMEGLGIKGPWFTGPQYENLSDFLKKNTILQAGTAPGTGIAAGFPNNLSYAAMVQGAAQDRPWSARRFPWLAQWIRLNRLALNQIVKASRLPKFYVPPIYSHRHIGLVGILLPYLATCKDITNALADRAMLELYEGKLAESEHDLLACHRIARLMTQSNILISTLVGYSIETSACQSDAALANAGWVTAKNYRNYAAELHRLPHFVPLAEALNSGERLFCLDMVQRIAKKSRRAALGKFGLSSYMPHGHWTTGELTIAKQWVNKFFDREVTAMKHRSFLARRIAYQHFMHWYSARLAFASRTGPPHVPPSLKFISPAPHIINIRAATAAQTELDQVSLALAAYRFSHGRYPNSPAALVGHFLTAPPDDPFTGKPLTYALGVGHCRVSSIGYFSTLYKYKLPASLYRLRAITVTLSFPPGRYFWPKGISTPGK